MAPPSDSLPSGAELVDGVVHWASDRSVEDTVAQLSDAIGKAGAKVFNVIDQAAEAKPAGLELRPTVLILFGSPRAGTPIMEGWPVAALDLPLRLLVWRAEDERTWISCLSGEWLAARYGVSGELVGVLSTPEKLARKITA